MITARDDGFIRTHDDAQALLRYAVPGARIEFTRLKTGRDQTRGYVISVSRIGSPVVAVEGAYSLPANAAQMAKHTREQADRAAQQG